MIFKYSLPNKMFFIISSHFYIKISIFYKKTLRKVFWLISTKLLFGLLIFYDNVYVFIY